VCTPMSDKPLSDGMVQIFTGSGKGKTSAALGTVLRALGHGLRVHIIFFMKGNYPYGERNMLPQVPNVSFESFGHEHFVDPYNVKEEEREQAREALQAAVAAIASDKFDIVVLDEVNVAIAWKLIEVESLLQMIEQKPRNVELILTGRYADQRVIEKADLVTEMMEVKHPYQKGVKARKGIEY
jgi:cob(I)alamin adenosyltransferase